MILSLHRMFENNPGGKLNIHCFNVIGGLSTSDSFPVTAVSCLYFLSLLPSSELLPAPSRFFVFSDLRWSGGRRPLFLNGTSRRHRPEGEGVKSDNTYLLFSIKYEQLHQHFLRFPLNSSDFDFDEFHDIEDDYVELEKTDAWNESEIFL